MEEIYLFRLNELRVSFYQIEKEYFVRIFLAEKAVLEQPFGRNHQESLDEQFNNFWQRVKADYSSLHSRLKEMGLPLKDWYETTEADRILGLPIYSIGAMIWRKRKIIPRKVIKKEVVKLTKRGNSRRWLIPFWLLFKFWLIARPFLERKEKLYSLSQVSSILGIKQATLRNWIFRKGIEGISDLGGRYWLREKEVERLKNLPVVRIWPERISQTEFWRSLGISRRKYYQEIKKEIKSKIAKTPLNYPYLSQKAIKEFKRSVI